MNKVYSVKEVVMVLFLDMMQIVSNYNNVAPLYACCVGA